MKTSWSFLRYGFCSVDGGGIVSFSKFLMLTHNSVLAVSLTCALLSPISEWRHNVLSGLNWKAATKMNTSGPTLKFQSVKIT